MKDVAGWFIILLLFFLFWGTPDVWDKLHERAMHTLSVDECYKNCQQR